MKDKSEILAILLEKWQRRLQLTNWEVDISIVDKKKMKKEVEADVDGCIKYEIYTLKANMFILNSVPEIELEEIVLHELLHLCLCDLTWFFKRINTYIGDEAVQELLDTFKTDYTERLLHQIASALLRERV